MPVYDSVFIAYYSVKFLYILMSKLRNSSVQRNIDPTDQLISAETIQFPAQEEELGGVHTDTAGL